MNSDDKYDFFDEEGTPEIEEKIETPEEKEEKEIANDTIKRGYNKLKLTIYAVTAIVFIWLMTMLWMRYFSPYTIEAQQTGRIMELKLQGMIFNTYEGKMLSEQYVDYPEKWLQYDFPFSVVNDSIARNIMRLQGTGKRIRITYQEFQGTLPWRGNSHRIVTGYEIVTE